LEKYGVDESKKDKEVKTAADKGSCPKCGSPLDKSANVHKCPTHGTEPFEEKGTKNAS
jgi:hypothetical protein